MKLNLVILLLLFLQYQTVFAQKRKSFSIEANYGLNANFFVNSYNETGPSAATYLYKKNLLGSVAGAQINYTLNPQSTFFAGYSRSVNKGRKNFEGNPNGVRVFVNDFTLRHFNNYFQIGYERSFRKSHPDFRYHAGIVLAGMEQQEIAIEFFSNQVLIEERNVKNSRLQEAGIFAGWSYVGKIDSHFELGLRMRAYYLVTSNNFEAITISPVLNYRFN